MIRPSTNTVATAGLVPSSYGILSPAVTVVKDESNVWLDGFTHEIRDARVGVVNRVLSHGPTGEDGGTATVSTPNNVDTLQTYYPFLVETTFTASAMAITPEALAAKATAALDLVLQKAIEQEFESGEIAKQLTVEKHDNRFLAFNGATDVTPTPGTAVKVAIGQTLLEGALGRRTTFGSAGVLHAPRVVADLMKTVLDTKDYEILTTPQNNNVVSGTGYRGLAPNGNVPANNQHYWMYATGPVTVRIGAVEYKQLTPGHAVNYRQNTIEYSASVPVAVTWSTSDLFAVLVDLSLGY